MSRSAVLTSIRRLRSVLAVQQSCEQSDEQLLAAFAVRRDEIAFAMLMRRYGPMVLGVCRRVLGHAQDAEDAYQATFLVFARRAAMLREKTALASFLYGTAHHLASKIKRGAGRRRKYESTLGVLTRPRSGADPVDELLWREVRELLDEEIARLPEKFRSVFVLCCLESLSRAEAAQRLGLKERTVLSRLAEARKRLSRRLARRGVELTAVLAATTLAAPSASALPAGLIAATIKAAMAAAAGENLGRIISASVIDLVHSATAAMMASKAKIAMMMLLTAALLAGTGGWVCRMLAMPQPVQRRTESPPAPPQHVAAKEPATLPQGKDEEITVSGRVLDPDGKPVKGARLSVPFSQRPRGVTDKEGRFSLKIPRSVTDPKRTSRLIDWNTYLVACADGFGLAWAEIPVPRKSGELTLRLVADKPIRGRILNTEGKPLAGVRVSMLGLVSTEGEHWNTFLAGWKQMGNNAAAFTQERDTLAVDENLLWVKTDAEGRFQLHGIGRERVVQLQVSGGGIAQGLLYVVTRPGVDPAPINQELQERTAQRLRWRGSPALLYGPSLLYVADPARALEGVIREAGSGKPVAGMTVSVLVDYINFVRATSDAHGRFRLEGLTKQPQYGLWAEPGGAGPWLGTGAIVRDVEGLQTLKVDLTTAKGVVVTGRVVDRTTGKGVPGEIRAVPLPGNPYADKPGYDSYRPNPLMTPTDAQGRFRLAVIPGPSVLLVHAEAVERMPDGTPLNPFTLPQLSSADRKRVSVRVSEAGVELLRTAHDKEEYLGHQNSCIVLDLAEDTGVVRRDVFVERGRTLTVQVQDAEGKPLPGCRAGGLTDKDWPTFLLNEPSCTVYALRPNRQRQLAFVHPQRHLAGLLILHGEEKESPTVRLKPTGKLIGRLVNADGQPLAGVRVRIDILGNEAARSVDTQLRWRREPICTDSDGRFRIENVIPELKHHFILSKGKAYLTIDSPFDLKKVQSGQTLDLGDILVKPQ